MSRYINEHSRRFGTLLKRGNLNQQELASQMSLLLGWIIHPSYISRWLHGKKELSLEEKLTMVKVLYGNGCLKQVEDRLWLGELLHLDEAQLGNLVPLSRPLLTNLPPPDDLPYLIPDSHVALKERLAPGPISAGRKDYHQARFVAVSGPPGSGKTALLHHLAADDEVRCSFPFILYASLGDHTDVAAVLQQWLVRLGETPAADRAREVLRHRLAGKRLLLLLDDLPDARLLPDLLVGDEGSRIVLTCSRDVAAEIGIPAGAIITHRSWDGPTANCYLEALWGRALTAREQALAYELNELIDGLPLCWMVLIPWLHSEQSWRDLRDEIAAAPLNALNWPHGRLRASLMAAYRRLPGPAQDLFRSLGVFALGAPFRAEAVAAILDLPIAHVRRSLHALNQASFLQTTQGLVGESHCQMHRLLHDLARELVAADPREDTLARRHAHFYAEHTRAIRQEQNSPSWAGLVRNMLPDLPNVRLGQERAAGWGDPLAVTYFLNLAAYLVATRQMDVYHAWGQAALPVVQAEPQSLSALDRLAFYAQIPADSPDRQRVYLERALAIAREEMVDEPATYRVYGLCWLAQHLYDEAGQALDAEPVLVEALEVAATSGYPQLETHALVEVARFFLLLRDRAGLEAVADRLPVSPPEMHAGGVSAAHYHTTRAEVLRLTGHWQEAEAAYDEVLGLHDAIGDGRHGATFRLRRALCRAYQGDVEGAAADLSWAEEHLEGLPWAVHVRYQLTLAELALVRGDARGAAAALADLPEEWPDDRDLALDAWLLWLRVHLALGQAEKARTARDQAQTLARARGFVLFFKEDQAAGRVAAAAAGSAPTLLAQVVGGRPPLR